MASYRVIQLWIVIFCSFFYVTQGQTQESNCTEHCGKNIVCSEGDRVAHETNCTKFYWCVSSTWREMDCENDLYWDNEECRCHYLNRTMCADQCPPTTPRPTQAPAPCDDVPEPCIEGTLYADVTDCRFFYECIDGELINRTQCNSNLSWSQGQCLPNLPCVFDIFQEKCINPTEDFDCYYRCITIPPKRGDFTTLLYTTDETTTDFIESTHLSSEISSVETDNSTYEAN